MWRVSKKQVFRIKYYPYEWIVISDKWIVKLEMWGWRFYPEPKAWTCFFEYPEQTFGFFFILFFVKMFTPNVLVNWGFRGCSIGSGEQGCGFLFFARRPRLGTVWQYGFMKMIKKKNTLLWWFDFWGCLMCVQYSDFSVQLIGNGRHLQKTIWYFLVRGQ